MKNKKAEEIIERLQEVNNTCAIKILGDKENKVYAFSIIASCQGFSSYNVNEYYGIKKNTLDLLNEGKIKYKILK